MALVDTEILTGFYQEAKDYFPDIRSGLATLKSDPNHREAAATVHRLVHSIKGAASMVGLSTLSHIAYLAEEAIEEATEGKLPTTKKTWAAIERAVESLAIYIESAASDKLQERPIVKDVVVRLRRLRGLPKQGDEAVIEELLQEAAESLDLGPGDRPGEPPSTNGFEYASISPELLEAFQSEAEEHMQSISTLLRKIKKKPGNGEALLELRRCVHTLKGATAVVGLTSTSELAHRMKDLLDQLHDGGTKLSDEILNLLFATADALEDLTIGRDPEKVGSRLQTLYQEYSGHLGGAAGDLPRLAGAVGGDTTAGAGLAPELREAFAVEAEEHVEAIGRLLRDLVKRPKNKDLTLEVRRRVHTLKGAAAMVGIQAASGLAHRMEDLLDGVHDEKVDWTDVVQNLLFSSTDALEDITAKGGVDSQLQNQLSKILADYDELLGTPETPPELPPDHALERLLGEDQVIDLTKMPAAMPAGQEAAKAEARQAAAPVTPSQVVRIPLDRLDELVRLVSELIVNRSTFEQHFSRYIREVDELNFSIERLKRISTNFETEYAVGALVAQQEGVGFAAPAGAAPVARTAANGQEGTFDTLELDRYSDIHLLSRDLTETSTDIGSVGTQFGNIIGDFDGYLNRLGRLSSEVQDKLMRLRMVPLASLASRLHRTVRVTAGKANKRADLTIDGENIELDKTVLEEMEGPLEHLLRNAVDHGVEPPELRRALGKPVEGQLRMRAYHEGTQVVIQVSDDGAGLQPELIRSKAVSKGFFTEAEAAELSEQDLYGLVFGAGFSTAKEISEVSGRGVGLDIVKSAVTRMKGRVSIESTPGRGVTFTIRLPMTLAITRVLLVKAYGEVFAVPLAAVTQIVRVEPDRIERVGRKEVIRIEGRVIPTTHLGEALGVKNRPEVGDRRLPVLVLQLGDRQIALVVDELMEAREVVVKTLGNVLRQVHGLTGATLMGDGSVVLIINPSDLMQESEKSISSDGTNIASDSAQKSHAYDVLIVDDSLSVRRVLSNLIRNTGWNPITAKDGVEALEVLQASPKKPDAVLLDIEMPRMDGYELTATLRGQSAYQNLPIVMLTSRAAQKHRQRAFELGATDYLVKPYQDETLVSVLRRVVRESRETDLE